MYEGRNLIQFIDPKFKWQDGTRFAENSERRNLCFSVKLILLFRFSCCCWDLVLDTILGFNFGPTTNATDGSCNSIDVALHESAQSGERGGQRSNQQVF